MQIQPILTNSARLSILSNYRKTTGGAFGSTKNKVNSVKINRLDAVLQKNTFSLSPGTDTNL